MVSIPCANIRYSSKSIWERPVSMKTMLLLLSLLFSFSSVYGRAEEAVPSWKDFPTGTLPARVAVHDPSIIAADGKYYIFGTHMTAAVSEDLRTWKMVCSGYNPYGKVWGDIFSEDSHVFDYACTTAHPPPGTRPTSVSRFLTPLKARTSGRVR